MSDRFNDSDTLREALSALADGEAQPHEVARASAAWKDQPELRATWHAYQLIGDVMRSEDLADTSQGGAFLKSFRERLAQEPVVLAPVAANASRAGVAVPVVLPPTVQPLRRRVWAGPMAVAAGFVMVVGALLTSQVIPSGGPAISDVSLAHATVEGAPDLSLALGGVQPAGQGLVALNADAGRPSVVSVGGASFSKPETGEAVLIRDPQLDQILSAHGTVSSGDTPFAGQGYMTRQVVFDAR